jgi:hypothetical protein
MLQKIRKIFLRISIILNGLLFHWTERSTGLIRENAEAANANIRFNFIQKLSLENVNKV